MSRYNRHTCDWVSVKRETHILRIANHSECIVWINSCHAPVIPC